LSTFFRRLCVVFGPFMGQFWFFQKKKNLLSWKHHNGDVWREPTESDKGIIQEECARAQYFMGKLPEFCPILPETNFFEIFYLKVLKTHLFAKYKLSRPKIQQYLSLWVVSHSKVPCKRMTGWYPCQVAEVSHVCKCAFYTQTITQHWTLFPIKFFKCPETL